MKAGSRFGPAGEGVRSTDPPVARIRGAERQGFYLGSVMVQRILTIVDGSFAAEMAARYSLALAKASAADLELLFVAGDRPRSAIKRAEESLLRLFGQAQSMGLKVRSVTEAGEPIRVIREYVLREGITLAISSVRDPAIASRLLREIPCAVLLVRVAHPGRMAWPHEILVPLYHGEF